MRNVLTINNNKLHIVYFVNAIISPAITIVDKGEALLVVTLNNHKIGYLKAVLAEGAVLIKTFLFLTNNSTPEGKKINELCIFRKQIKNIGRKIS